MEHLLGIMHVLFEVSGSMEHILGIVYVSFEVSGSMEHLLGIVYALFEVKFPPNPCSDAHLDRVCAFVFLSLSLAVRSLGQPPQLHLAPEIYFPA